MALVAIGGTFSGAATTVAGQEEVPTVPSGISLTLQDVMIDDAGAEGRLVRFRYVAPTLEKSSFSSVEQDFPALCAEQVVPWVMSDHPEIRRAVISIASEPVEFGVAAPDVTQFFEMFRIEGGACIWEGL